MKPMNLFYDLPIIIFDLSCLSVSNIDSQSELKWKIKKIGVKINGCLFGIYEPRGSCLKKNIFFFVANILFAENLPLLRQFVTFGNYCFYMILEAVGSCFQYKYYVKTISDFLT